jgi:aryl-alcohol dehydrogenase-like predicted oxidoreductase
MDLTQTAYGNWSGGRFMHFGETLPEERFVECMRVAYAAGIRTFVTADVYGNGKADELLGRALAGVPRATYCLVGMVGHDFYTGEREGSRGYPRFTDPALRGPEQYGAFLQMACERSLARCGTDHFDLLMLHNPDERGYTHEAVWEGMRRLRDAGLTKLLGIAPGPANGFTLDLIDCYERYGEAIDWAMLILSPLEPWPVGLSLPACAKHGVKVLTRVVDHGGVFHGDIKPHHVFRPGDHRAFRPAGWVEHALEKIDRMKPVADRHGLSLLHFAAIWNLSQEPVASAVPTFVQEAADDVRPIEDKIREFAALPDLRLSAAEVAEVRAIGDNTGCMLLKGASRRHAKEWTRPDEWPMRPDLLELAQRYGLGDEW